MSVITRVTVIVITGVMVSSERNHVHNHECNRERNYDCNHNCNRECNPSL